MPFHMKKMYFLGGQKIYIWQIILCKNVRAKEEIGVVEGTTLFIVFAYYNQDLYGKSYAEFCWLTQFSQYSMNYIY